MKEVATIFRTVNGSATKDHEQLSLCRFLGFSETKKSAHKILLSFIKIWKPKSWHVDRECEARDGGQRRRAVTSDGVLRDRFQKVRQATDGEEGGFVIHMKSEMQHSVEDFA